MVKSALIIILFIMIQSVATAQPIAKFEADLSQETNGVSLSLCWIWVESQEFWDKNNSEMLTSEGKTRDNTDRCKASCALSLMW